MSGESGAEPFPYGHLLWEMTRGEVLLRDQGTALGFLWTLLHPALMFVVLYGVFARWVAKAVDGYVLYLLAGLFLWNFFQKATTYALGSFKRARGTVLNYRFPREIVVLSAVGAVLWSSLMELAVLLAAAAFLGQTPRVSWLLLPVILAVELELALGVGLFLAVGAVEFQDVERIWEVLSAALFYLTPVFYPLAALSPRLQALLRFNPLVLVLELFRACLTSAGSFSAGRLAAAALGGALLSAAGVALVRLRQFQLADKLLV